MSIADDLNDDLAAGMPAAAACLSKLGKRAFFPKGIPFQSGQARGTRYNGTIGQVTDGHGSPLPLPAIAEVIDPLEPRMSHLYSPPAGHGDLRKAWAARQRSKSGGSTVATTLPFLTLGLTQALSFTAELFVEGGRPVLVPVPRWGNYDQVFNLRRGGDLVPYTLFEDGAFSLDSLRSALAATSGPAVLVLNFPHNPTGYTPTAAEGLAIVEMVLAHPGPLVVLVDDAYAGMFYEEDVLPRSLFWDLAEGMDPERHVIAKADGVTKELLFFPGRVGFLTLAGDPDSPAAAAIESKLGCLARSGLGSPPGPSQAAVLHALQRPDLESQIQAAVGVLGARYQRLREAFDALDEPAIRPLPFNSGVFALVEIDGLDAGDLREHLIAHHDVGVISLAQPNALRIAFCSVAEEDIEGLVAGIVAGVRCMRGEG